MEKSGFLHARTGIAEVTTGDSAKLDYALRDTLVSHVAQTEQSSARMFEGSATDVVGKVRGEYIQHTRQLERCKRFCSRSDQFPSVDYDQKA